ncbi:AI-2E family transporter [Faunimonas sp. B44]|uniref:AI-2E family transporter n=1 Tax=Faunimonas sp. B44 TaxID=3461493 RepID=UPI004044AB38
MPVATQHEKLLGLGALLALAVGCLVVIWPFLTAIMWAAVLCWSTWPVYRGYERALGGRRGLSAALMTVTVALVIVAPFALLVAALAESVGDLIGALGRVVEEGPPAPPAWIGEIPIIGESVSSYWQSLALNAPAFLAALGRFTGPAADVALASGAFIGVGLLELGLSVFIAFFLYLNGRQIAAYVRESSERVAGHRARRLLKLIGSTIKGVIFGLIGTALAQGLLAALGFWMAGVEQALLFGFFTFILSFLPAGPPLVWGGVAVWLVVQGDFWWGIFVAVWGALLVSTIDNLLRPYLLAQSNNLPVVLGLFGFIGGILAFGFIGIFVGPVLLAVGYSLFLEWANFQEEETEP